MTAPGKGGGSVGANFSGHESSNRLPHAALAPLKLTPQTCSWSLRSRPSSWGRRVRPWPGAAACGVQRRGPRAGPGVPAPGGGRGAAGRGRRRGGETSRLRRGLLHLPRPQRRRRLLVASSALSSASTSTQNKNTPHLPATPLLIGQSRPGLGTAWGGGRRSARRPRSRRRRRGTTPPPLPGAARDRPAGNSRSAAAAAAAQPALASKARKPTARRRGREVPICLCICVWEGLWGGCECARARGPVRERRARQLHTALGPPLLPSASKQHAPTQQALELSGLSSQPHKSCRFFPGSLCWHTLSFPATQLPSPVTHCRLEPKVQQAVPARSHFPPLSGCL